MIPVYLIHELAELTKHTLDDYILHAELQSNKPVSVYEQYLPAENFEDDTFYPLVIVSLARVESDINDSIATVTFTIGTYNSWQDMLNIAERLRQKLSSVKIVGDKFLNIMPVEFEPQTDQPEPFFFGTIITRYQLGSLRVS